MLTGEHDMWPFGVRDTPFRPTLDDVGVDSATWSVYDVTPTRRGWLDTNGDAILLRLFEQPCPESTVAGWRAKALRETTAAGGTSLSFDDGTVGGLRAFIGLFKFPASKAVPGVPADSLAVYIVGMMVIPVGDSYFQFNTEAAEVGQTGLREAAFGVTQPRPTIIEGAETRPSGTMEGYFARVRECLAIALPSDAPEHDPLVPTHPLSRVRAMQRHIIRTAQFSDRITRRMSS